MWRLPQAICVTLAPASLRCFTMQGVGWPLSFPCPSCPPQKVHKYNGGSGAVAQNASGGLKKPSQQHMRRKARYKNVNVETRKPSATVTYALCLSWGTCMQPSAIHLLPLLVCTARLDSNNKPTRGAPGTTHPARRHPVYR